MSACVSLQDKISNKHFGLVNTGAERRLLLPVLIIFGSAAYVPQRAA